MKLNLDEYRYNITSEHGENGILLILSRILKEKNKIGVEIGASDGVTSNNLRPFIFRGWNIYYIEGDPSFYKKLLDNTKEYINVHTKFSYIYKAEDLNNILEGFNIPIDFDIFSLDIDNIDYWIWKGLKYKPKVVCIEYNSDLPENTTVMKSCVSQRKDKSGFYGAHPYSISKLADSKGYDLVNITASNMIFIKSEINVFEKLNPIEQVYRKRNRIITEEEKKLITGDLEL